MIFTGPNLCGKRKKGVGIGRIFKSGGTHQERQIVVAAPGSLAGNLNPGEPDPAVAEPNPAQPEPHPPQPADPVEPPLVRNNAEMTIGDNVKAWLRATRNWHS